MKYLILLLLLIQPVFAFESFITQGDVVKPFAISIEPVLNFQSKTEESMIDLSNAPFRKAINQISSQEVKISPIQGLSLNFAQKEFEQKNLREQTLNLWEENNFNFLYDNENTNFTFKRNIKKTYNPQEWNINRIAKEENTSKNTTLSLRQNLGTLSFNFSQNITEDKKEIKNTQYGFNIPFDRAVFAFQQGEIEEKNNIGKTQNIKISALLSGETVKYEHGYTVSNNLRKNTTNVNLPLPFASVNINSNKTYKNNKLSDIQKLNSFSTMYFGEELKYVSGFNTSIEKNNTIGTDIKEIMIPFGKIIRNTTYRMSDKTVYTNSKLTSRNMSENIEIPINFLINGGILKYDRNLSLVSGKTQVDSVTKQMIIPLKFIDDKAEYSFVEQNINNNSIERHSFSMPINKTSLVYQQINNNHIKTENLIVDNFVEFKIPLSFVFSYIQDQKTNKTDSRFNTTIKVPLSLFGETIENEHILAFSTLGQDNIQSNFVIPTHYGPVMASRIAKISKKNERLTTYTTSSPKVDFLGINLSANYMVLDDEKQKKEKRIIDVSWNPNKKTSSSVMFGMNELDLKEYRTTNLKSEYLFSENSKLYLQYLEADTKNQSSSEKTHIAFSHIDENFSLKTSLINLNPNQESLLRSIETTFGQEENIKVSASLTNYDPAKLNELQETAIGLETKHNSGDNDILIKYQRNANRIPMFLIGTSFKIDDTIIKIARTENPEEPKDNKKIRKGDVWDVSLSKRNIQTNVRFYDDNYWLNLNLSEGDRNKNGILVLSYQNGDFINNSQNKKLESSLNLKYDKQWDDAGNLSLTLSQEKAPVENTEARLDFNLKF